MNPEENNPQPSPPPFVDPNTVNIERTETNAPAATDSQAAAVGEKALGGTINYDQSNTTAQTQLPKSPKTKIRIKTWQIITVVAVGVAIIGTATGVYFNNSSNSKKTCCTKFVRDTGSVGPQTFDNSVEAWKSVDISKDKGLLKDTFVYKKEPTSFSNDFPDADNSKSEVRVATKQILNWTMDLNGTNKGAEFFNNLTDVDEIWFSSLGSFSLDSKSQSARVYFGKNAFGDINSATLTSYNVYPAISRSVWIAPLHDEFNHQKTSSYYTGGFGTDETYYPKYGGDLLNNAKKYAQKILDKYVVSSRTDLVSNYGKYALDPIRLAKGYDKPEDNIEFSLGSDGSYYYYWKSNYWIDAKGDQPKDIKVDFGFLVGMNKDGTLCGWEIIASPNLFK